jgi:hypothetical protein
LRRAIYAYYDFFPLGLIDALDPAAKKHIIQFMADGA